MVRSQHSKVRTGCSTCKARRVKCDEGRPVCMRCSGAGRKCGGYPTALDVGHTLPRYRIAHLFQSFDRPAERRAVQFFCERVGMYLSGPLDSYFWTCLVIQFSNFEPAICHSVLAISSLSRLLQDGCTPHQLRGNPFALHHYTMAISCLRRTDHEPLVLLVCLLFICIEALCGNQEQAIQHAEHGLAILQRVEPAYPWIQAYVSPIFRRLRVFPVFFKQSGSPPQEPDTLQKLPVKGITSFREAQRALDELLYAASCLRRKDGPPHGTEPLNQERLQVETNERRSKIIDALDVWLDEFRALHQPDCKAIQQQEIVCRLMVQYHTARLAARAELVDGEPCHRSIDEAQSVIEQSERLAAIIASRKNPNAGSLFSFEVGFLPHVVFAIFRSSDLHLQLRALHMLEKYADIQENTWHPVSIYPMCKRFIEQQHDMRLAGETDYITIEL